MNWRNPKKELPVDNQHVYVMIEPHKDRGTYLNSYASIQIVGGEVSIGLDGSYRVENYDELGYGSVAWYLLNNTDDWGYDNGRAIAWIPVEEMAFPTWSY